MEIDFPKSQEEFLRRQVEEGRFLSVSEAVRIAVRDMERREHLEHRALENERAFVAVGLEQADRGECRPLDQDEINREGKRRLELLRSMRET